MQFDLPNNVLRFEVKVLTMQFLRKKGVEVRYFADLLNLNIYEPLSKILIETFEEILFQDNSIDRCLIEDKDEKIYLLGINKEEWKPKNGNSAEWKRLARREITFRSIIEKYRTGLDFQCVVAQLITAKCSELCNPPPQVESFLSVENVHYLATQKDKSDSEIDSEKMENVHYLDLYYMLKTGQPENSNNEQSDKPKIKKCSGCGKPIEQDKTYHNEDCRDRKLERNAKSNPQHNFRTKYYKSVNTNQVNLFGISILNEQHQELINRKLKKNYSNKKS